MATQLAAVPYASPRCLDPFRVLPAWERERQLAAYRRLLAERDGPLAFASGRLPRREEYLRRELGRSVVSRRRVDAAEFERWLRSRELPAERRLQWLIAVARSDEGETHAVEVETQRLRTRGEKRSDPIALYAILEERYHTRLLAEVCRSAGLEGFEHRTPGRIQRMLVSAMQYLPDRVRFAPILCGEVLGCWVFRALHDSCDEVFGDEPEVKCRLQSLLSEILFDEVFHVVYCRAVLPPLALRVARRLMPAFVTVLARTHPQIRRFGCGRREIAGQLARGVQIPAAADWLESATP